MAHRPGTWRLAAPVRGQLPEVGGGAGGGTRRVLRSIWPWYILHVLEHGPRAQSRSGRKQLRQKHRRFPKSPTLSNVLNGQPPPAAQRHATTGVESCFNIYYISVHLRARCCHSATLDSNTHQCTHGSRSSPKARPTSRFQMHGGSSSPKARPTSLCHTYMTTRVLHIHVNT